ncbi:MAG TPA: permease-like cell division protein FtsX [Micromonosporaceae bacterium]|jgi:cell division transport system permease protein
MRFKYVINEVMVGLWRNVTMTIAMIITMAVSLTLLGASLLLYKQVDRMKDAYSQNAEVSLFFRVGDTEETKHATPEQKAAIENALASDPLVSQYWFEDKTEAYRKFSILFASTPDLVELTKSEDLPESYRVKLKDPSTVPQFEAKYEQYVNDQGGLELILDQKKLLEKVFSVLGSLQKLALIISIVQAVAALMLVINTIQIAAYSKRREVAVMKLVGASNWFIQAPFVLEAVSAGLIGAVIAYGTLVLAKIYIFDSALAPLTSVLTEVPWTNVNLMLPVLGAGAALISSITGWIALRFYIKV